MLATYSGHEDIVQHLVDSKATVDMRNTAGKNALDYANIKANSTIINILKKGSKK
jgi:ankyrin repeat protein